MTDQRIGPKPWVRFTTIIAALAMLSVAEIGLGGLVLSIPHLAAEKRIARPAAASPAGPAPAGQAHPMPHSDRQAGPGAEHDAASGVMRIYREAAERMHEAMDIAFTGDADYDFARGMIAHHHGAIDMARIVIEHGSDPGMRELAEEVIAAQEGEIAYLQDWLARHPRN